MATTNSILKAIVWLCISLDWCARAHSSIAGDAIFSNRLLSALQNIDFDKFKREEFEEKKHIGGASLENGYNDLRCLQHLSDLRNALNSSKLWAIQVADACGKPQSGILAGNLIELGNFDQCIAVAHSRSPGDKFEGQYCLMQAQIDLATMNMSDLGVGINAFGTYGSADAMHTPNATKARLQPATQHRGPYLGYGICAPATCSPKMLITIIDAAFKEANLNTVDVIITPHTCQKSGPATFQTDEIIVFSFFGVVATLMIASTSYDVIRINQKRKRNGALIAFSIYTNGQKILACKRSYSPDVLDCLHGIRAISTCWILYCHTHTMTAIAPVVNYGHVLEWVKHYYSMLVLSGVIAVDTFFFMSGLLLSWSMLKQLHKTNGSMNYVLLYIHRYLRLTPLLAVCVLIAIYIFKYLGDGPLWQLYNHVGVENNCRHFWWSTLLYVQNYYNPNSMCVGHSWYLSVDMQLFIASPPLIYLLYRFKNKALAIPAVFCLLSIVLTIWLYVEHNLTVKLIASDGGADRTSKLHYTYYATHSRMGAWMVGILFGYALYGLNGRKIDVPKSLIGLGWFASLATLLAVVFLNYPLQQIEHHSVPLIDGLYDSLSRLTWPMALSFIVFACHFGYGGPIDWLLSLPQWQPISRLTYAIYLMHMPTILLVVAQTRTAASFSHMTALHHFLGYALMTIFISFWLSLAFESPVLVLEKLLFHKDESKLQKTEAKSKQDLILNEAIEQSSADLSRAIANNKSLNVV